MKLIRPIVMASLLLSTLPAFADTTVTAQVSKSGENACVSQGNRFSKLNLSTEQRDKLAQLHDQFTLSSADKIAELKVAHREMHRLFEQPAIDKQAVLSLQTKINGLRDELSTAKLNTFLASADVFTPEQRAVLAKMHAQGGWRHHRFGREGRVHSERTIG